jgi:KIF-1 binding protein C terminal
MHPYAQEQSKEVTEETRAFSSKCWGRLYLARLDASIVDPNDNRHPSKTASSEPRPLPPFLLMAALPVPPADELPWGAKAYARSFEQARDLFNNALPKLKEALKYHKLDGFVTDHIELLFDVSKAYGCAAYPTHRQALATAWW